MDHIFVKNDSGQPVAAAGRRTEPPLEILAFSDPVCTWCWGSEPILKKLELAYGPALQIRPVMGGMVRDMRDFEDSANGIGGAMDEVNAQIAGHWLEASQVHGMPVQAEGFALFSDEQPSSWPLNMAYKAAAFEDAGKALRLLRRIREAVAAEALAANTLAVLRQLALECGLDEERFVSHMQDGSAEAAFHKDLALTATYGVQVFPTYVILAADGAGRKLEGYIRYAEFVRQISQLTGGRMKAQLPQSDPESIVDYLRRTGRAAEKELLQIFDLQPSDWLRMSQRLLQEGRLRRTPVGNGHWIEAL